MLTFMLTSNKSLSVTWQPLHYIGPLGQYNVDACHACRLVERLSWVSWVSWVSSQSYMPFNSASAVVTHPTCTTLQYVNHTQCRWSVWFSPTELCILVLVKKLSSVTARKYWWLTDLHDYSWTGKCRLYGFCNNCVVISSNLNHLCKMTTL